MVSNIRKLLLWSGIALTIGAASAKAQSLCSDVATYSSTSQIGTLINFIDFDPAKLRLNGSCDISGQCSYSFAFRTGNGFEQRYDDFTVTDLCNSIALSRERFKKVSQGSAPSGSIASYHDFRAKTMLTVSGDEITLRFIRNDFNFEANSIGWFAPSNQADVDDFVSAPLAVSTFDVEIIWER